MKYCLLVSIDNRTVPAIALSGHLKSSPVYFGKKTSITRMIHNFQEFPRGLLSKYYTSQMQHNFSALMGTCISNVFPTSPRRNGLVVRGVACEAREPGFNSSSHQMVFLLSSGIMR